MKLFLIMVMRRTTCDPAAVPAHLQFLNGLRTQQRVERSGPFGDKSGGAYLLRAADLAEALAIAFADPAHLSGSWDVTVREWLAS